MDVPKQRLLVDQARLDLDTGRDRKASEHKVNRTMISWNGQRPFTLPAHGSWESGDQPIHECGVRSIPQGRPERVGLEPKVQPDDAEKSNACGDRQGRGFTPFYPTDLGSAEACRGTQPVLADPCHPSGVTNLHPDALTEPRGATGALVKRSISARHPPFC